MYYPSSGFKIDFQRSSNSRNIVLQLGNIRDSETNTSRVVGQVVSKKILDQEYTIYYEVPSDKIKNIVTDYTIQERTFTYPNLCPLVRVKTDVNGKITAYSLYTNQLPTSEYVETSGKLGDILVEEIRVVGNKISTEFEIMEIIEIYLENIGEVILTDDMFEGNVITLEDNSFDGIIANVQYMKGL